MRKIGFTEIDLGALPGVCDHVPYELTEDAVADIAEVIAASGLVVRSVNGDIGDLNAPFDPAARAEHLDRLLRLTHAVGARALVLPCGAQSHEPIVDEATDIAAVAAALRIAADRASAFGIELWVESLHSFRLCHDLRRAELLHEALAGSSVGVVLDVSHVTATGSDVADVARRFGSLVRHVHLRDARPGDIHLSIPRGDVDFAAGFAALRETGFDGHFALELETRDIEHDERPRAAASAAAYLAPLI